MYEGGWEDDR
jgi:hypothetical protein